MVTSLTENHGGLVYKQWKVISFTKILLSPGIQIMESNMWVQGWVDENDWYKNY